MIVIEADVGEGQDWSGIGGTACGAEGGLWADPELRGCPIPTRSPPDQAETGESQCVSRRLLFPGEYVMNIAREYGRGGSPPPDWRDCFSDRA